MNIEVRLQTLKGSKTPQCFTLHRPQILIGRSKGCQVRIPSAQVSRQHCRLDVLDGALILKDLNSSNGTFLNGARVTGNRPLFPGDQLAVGPVIFQVHFTIPNPFDQPIPAGEIMDAEEVPFGEIIDEDANVFADDMGSPLDALGAIEASAVEEAETSMDVGNEEIDDDDWSIPLDENAHDFLSQFDNDDGR